MSATVKQRKTGVGECYLESREAPKIKEANEITYDYVWNKLYPSPISVTGSKWYIKKAPFVLRAQPLDSSLLSRCQLV
jgi:hypothetical protein